MNAGRRFERHSVTRHAVILVIASLLSGWGASYPQNTWLQVGPVIAFAAAIPALDRRLPLSGVAWTCITAFLLLHLFAAHWTYSDVPYDQWLAAVGIDMKFVFGTGRNMFDRLVHFAFGLLAVRPVMDLEQGLAGLSRRTAMRSAILVVLAASAIYEIFEWSLAIIVSPEAAEAYNGQQGDAFDAQKDMLLAFLGAMVSLLFFGRRSAAKTPGVSE